MATPGSIASRFAAPQGNGGIASRFTAPPDGIAARFSQPDTGSIAARFATPQPQPQPTSEGLWGRIGNAVSEIVHNPEKAASFVFGTSPEVTQQAYNQMQKPGLENKLIGGTEYLVSGVPFAGKDIAKAMMESGKGQYKKAAIHTAEGAAQAALLPVAGEKLASEIAGHEAEEYLPEAGQALRKAKAALLDVKTAPVPADSAIATLTKGAPVPEARVVGTDAEKAELEHTATVERPESGIETAKVVSQDHVPVVSKEEILSEAVQKTIDNSKILQTVGIDPENIYSSADVEKQLNSAADALKSNLDTRATTPLTFTMQKQLASDLGMSVEDLLSRKSGTAFAAEEVSAARALLKESQTRVMNLARLAATGDEDYIQKFNEALAQHKTILDTVKGRVAKEAGRALGAFRIAQEDLPSAKLSDLMSKLDPKAAKRAAELISHTDPEDVPAINKLIAEITPSSTEGKIFEAWQNFLLSSPKTSIIKASSDVSMLVLDTLAKGATGAMAQGKALLTGDTPDRYALDAWSFAKGAADAIGKAGKTLFGVAPDDFLGFEQPRTREYAIKGVVGKIVRIPMTTLSRISDAVATLNYAGQLNVLAYRQAIAEGLTGQELEARAAQLASDPTPEMRTAAFNFAEKQVFQAELGKTGAAFQRWVRSTPGLRYLFPFVKTPLSIVKTAAEFSPGGLAKGLATGNVDLAGRGLVGSAIASAIAYHVLQGNVTGGGPVMPAKKYALEDTGWQPYSLHIGNKFYSYDRLEPLGMVLGMTADLVHAIDKGEDPTSATVESRATQIQEAIMRNLESLPFMYSVSNLMQAFSPDNKNGIRNFLSRQAASIVPAVVAQTAAMVDRTVRRPGNAFQRIESRIPGLSENVPAELNVAGQPVKRPVGQFGGMNPFPVSEESTDPALREMGELGETSIHPPKTVTEPRRGLHLRRDEKSPRVKVTPEESRQLQAQDETKLHAWLLERLNNPDWKTLTANEKRSEIKKERSEITRTRWDRLQQIRSALLGGAPTSLGGSR